jgi:nicotinate-nucleotide pyrophosphorylase (carboxylating)
VTTSTLPPGTVREVVLRALTEDLAHQDSTTDALFDLPVPARATVVSEESHELVLAGLSVAIAVFAEVDPGLVCRAAFADGDRVPPRDGILTVHGDGRAILKGERVALNFLQRLTGIATLTAKFCEAVKGTPVRILDTRKTTPGLRALEKWAVRLGGGQNHRFGLGEGVLIKDNHLALFGGDVAAACHRAREHASPGFRIEVETRTLDEVRGALAGKADIILLDNMSPAMIREALDIIKGHALVEVSGGVSLATIREIALAGPDSVSIGALTHSAPAANLSLDLVKQ